MDEGAFNRLFNKENNLIDVKIFLEGGGLIVENKQKHPKNRWEGVPVVITSNVLPSVMNKPHKYNNEE